MANAGFQKQAGARCVLVVGCHRSGTSLVSSLLHGAGLVPSTEDVDEKGDQFNPRGLWESRSLVQLNSKILAELGVDWDSAPFMPPSWHRGRSCEYWQEEVRALAAQASVRGDWTWKDPRLCITLPLYVSSLTPRPLVLWVQRHPLAVAESLHRRNHFPQQVGLAMWGLSNAHVAHALSAEIAATVVHYEDLITSPEMVWDALRRWLADHGVLRVAPDFDARAYVDPALRRAEPRDVLSPAVARAYRLCEGIYSLLRSATVGQPVDEFLPRMLEGCDDHWRELLAAYAMNAMLREADRLRPLAVGYEKLAAHPIVRIGRRLRRLVRRRKS